MAEKKESRGVNSTTNLLIWQYRHLKSRFRRDLLRARSKELDMSTHIIARPAILVSQALILQNGVTIVVKN